MNISKKIVLSLIVAVSLFLVFMSVAIMTIVTKINKQQEQAVGFASYNTTPSFQAASSTWYTITTASVKILASSTPTRRQGITIQPINCTAATNGVFLATNDAAAIQNTGSMAYASTTYALSDYASLPVVQGAVRAIASQGTCTVLVTEWRSQY